jgi:hypothetical protein
MATVTRRTLTPLLKHLAQKPPRILYHYTSLEVLEKITPRKKIEADPYALKPHDGFPEAERMPVQMV